MHNNIIKTFKRIWPKSLFMQLAIVWPLSLFTGHTIQAVIYQVAYNKQQIIRTDYYFLKDLTLLLSQLENASLMEKQRWVKLMARNDYNFALSSEPSAPIVMPDERTETLLFDIRNAIGNNYSISLSAAQSASEAYRLGIQLNDGTPLVAIINKSPSTFRWLNILIFFLQMAAIVLFTWVAVKLATRSLARLATAAETLGTSLHGLPIPEDGPSEVARAATAFNAMQEQIKNHLAERVHILASISHDLQTPITRMRLRADLMDDTEQQNKWLSDLNSMQLLVEEGITYARSAQRTTETTCRVDADALLDSLMCDYVDAGQNVCIHGEVGKILLTRPNALKRIITNLIDNALKFFGAAEINITHPTTELLVICVLDRGPGIPEHELTTVLQPFYRLENSRNRHTGGTGLGLAIAAQLAHALEGELKLYNRTGGGLVAQLSFPINLGKS